MDGSGFVGFKTYSRLYGKTPASEIKAEYIKFYVLLNNYYELMPINENSLTDSANRVTQIVKMLNSCLELDGLDIVRANLKNYSKAAKSLEPHPDYSDGHTAIKAIEIKRAMKAKSD